MTDSGNVRAFLVNPHSGSTGINEATILPPVGLVYIGTYLRSRGFDCVVHDANIKASEPGKTAARAAESGAHIVGVYLNSFMIDWTIAFIREVRARAGHMIIGIGGPLASHDPAKSLETVGADFAIAGEGEFPMEKICENISSGGEYFTEVPGITYEQSGQIKSGPPNQRVADLDLLPFPDYSILGRLEDYKVRAIRFPTAPIVTSRGCPFQCTFCSKAVFQSRTTFRSPQNVVDEMYHLKNAFGARQIDILDDNFTLKREYAEEVIDRIIEADLDLAINLQSGVRVEHLDELLLTKMKKAGVAKIGFGIESADELVLEKCRKRLDLEKLRDTVAASKKLGITVSGYFIIGLPGETRESVKETIRLAKSLKLDAANFAMAIPFPGTELHKYVSDNGRFLIDPEGNYDYGFFASKAFYELDDISQAEMKYRFDMAYWSFYTPGKILRDIFAMRSISELGWYINAGFYLVRGKARAFFHEKSRDGRETRLQ